VSAQAPAAVATRRSPYQGLVPYTETDAEWFFGRDEWCEVIGDNVRAYRIVVLYGASGVGKSSILRAGLIRRLRDEAHDNLAALGSPRMLPVHFAAWSLDDPLAALKEAVSAEGAAFGQTAHEGESLAEFLGAWPARVGGPLLLVLDQLEELFVYHDRRGDATMEELTTALRSRDPAIHFLLALREEALSKLDRFEGHVPGLLDHLLRLEHLDRDAARRAIVDPLERWNETLASADARVQAERDLVEAVLDQVETGKVSLDGRGPSALDGGGAVAGVEAPYLQLVLERLWDEERREGSRDLRLATLERLGGATVIVRTHLDAALTALPARDQDVAGRTLPYLVTPSGTKIAHRVGDLAAYAQIEETRLEPLVDRLAGDVRILRPAGDGRFEIYHDALAGPILDWNARWQARLRRRRERRRLAVIGAVALVLAAIAVAIAILAIQAGHAKSDARRGQSRALAAQALATTDTDPVGALRAAVEAADVAPTADADGALRVALASDFLRRTLRGHENAVWTAAFSPDGKVVVTGGDDRTARVWDAATGRTMHVLRGHLLPVSSVVFSPDGTRVVTAAGDGTARIWSVGSGKLLHLLLQHPGSTPSAAPDITGDHDVSVSGAAFSPNGKLVVTAGGDGTARVWNVASGRSVRVLRGGERKIETDVAGADRVHAVQDARFSSDGKRIVTAGADGTARIWDAGTGRRLETLSTGADPVRRAAFSPDGTRMLTLGDEVARIWDVATHRLLHVLSYPDDSLTSAAFSPNGRLVVTSEFSGTVGIWSAARGRSLHVLSGHADAVRSAVFSPDGRLVVTAGGDDATARIWSVASGADLRTLRHNGPVLAATFSRDGRQVVTAGGDATARIWDASDDDSLRLLRRGDDIAGGAISPDGALLLTTGYVDNTPWLWSLSTGVRTHVLRGHRGALTSASFSPDGTLLLTASSDKTARIWRVASGRSLRVLVGHRAPLTGAEFSPDGTRVVTTAEDRTARIWSVASGRSLHVLAGHHHALVWAAAFSPDGTRVVTAGEDGTARVWNVADGRRLLTLRAGGDGVRGAAFSPDGRLIATAGRDGLVMLWDAGSGRRLHVLRGHTSDVYSAAFSPDGTRLVTASGDGTARLWETASGRSLHVLRGHLYPVVTAIFSGDGQLVLTAGRDGTARVWDAGSGRSLEVLRGHTASLTDGFFVPGEPRIVTTSEDGTARIWRCDLCGLGRDELLARAHRRLSGA
jgi:WD40 repeat protein